MPRGLNGTHRELSLARIVVLVIWRPPALAGPWGSKHQRRLRFRPLIFFLAILRHQLGGPHSGGPWHWGVSL